MGLGLPVPTAMPPSRAWGHNPHRHQPEVRRRKGVHTCPLPRGNQGLGQRRPQSPARHHRPCRCIPTLSLPSTRTSDDGRPSRLGRGRQLQETGPQREDLGREEGPEPTPTPPHTVQERPAAPSPSSRHRDAGGRQQPPGNLCPPFPTPVLNTDRPPSAVTGMSGTIIKSCT